MAVSGVGEDAFAGDVASFSPLKKDIEERCAKMCSACWCCYFELAANPTPQCGSMCDLSKTAHWDLGPRKSHSSFPMLHWIPFRSVSCVSSARTSAVEANETRKQPQPLRVELNIGREFLLEDFPRMLRECNVVPSIPQVSTTVRRERGLVTVWQHESDREPGQHTPHRSYSSERAQKICPGEIRGPPTRATRGYPLSEWQLLAGDW
jgi:hypothetical protein